MIRSMLYATDLGLYAPLVLQHALSMARTFNANLYVLHVVEPMGQLAQSVLESYLDQATLDALHEQGLNTVMATIENRVFDTLRQDLGSGNPDLALISALRVRQGDPWQVILEQAETLGVDLMVLGSHSHVGGKDVPLGRTAVRVLQLAAVPVYMVPLSQQPGAVKN
ncbi:universal stress protein [Pseudomonas sp. dw_358]|uniref:universal stress protein n=1 Tax=Pseudomonas sp. dw_358 TaxID=2720083 RepID=UPI001BD4DA8D|nr:universal stress protein [Pseudomonas sp. dw_358]